MLNVYVRATLRFLFYTNYYLVVKLSSILIIFGADNSKTISDETKPYNSHKTVIHKSCVLIYVLTTLNFVEVC